MFACSIGQSFGSVGEGGLIILTDADKAVIRRSFITQHILLQLNRELSEADEILQIDVRAVWFRMPTFQPWLAPTVQFSCRLHEERQRPRSDSPG